MDLLSTNLSSANLPNVALSSTFTLAPESIITGITVLATVMGIVVACLVLPIENRYSSSESSCSVVTNRSPFLCGKTLPEPVLFFSPFRRTFAFSSRVSLLSTVSTLFSNCRTRRIFHVMAHMTATETHTLFGAFALAA